MSEQNFKNHGRFVPSYHFFALPVFSELTSYGLSPGS